MRIACFRNALPACLALGCSITFAQTDIKLQEELLQTGYIHSSLLPIDESNSFEASGIKKKVLKSVMLCDMEEGELWTHRGDRSHIAERGAQQIR